MGGDLIFDLSATQSAFVHSDAHVAMLMGPMGEGKTFCGVAGLMRHAQRCGQDIRGALIRDTHTNIKISTVPDIKQELGAYVDFHDDAKRMVIHSTPKVEVDLFGIDDPASLSKLQGPQYAIIWLEEPAPIVEKANAGLPKDVFDLSVARASRQQGTTLRVQITQNPADEDHWTEELAMAPRILEEDLESGLQIIKEVYRIPYGENKYLNPLARLANKAAFRGDPGKYARYVEGRAAPVAKGKAVTPGYNSVIHFSQDRELKVVPNLTGVRFYDGYHHPVCIIGQLVPPGRLWIHDVLWGDGMGITELITQEGKPLLETPKYLGKIHTWRDIGDPSMKTPDQSTTGVTSARRVEQLFDTHFEKGPTRWAPRINPLTTALTALSTDGAPVIVISRSAYNVHRALNGGWHWKKDNNGNIVGNVPVKDKWADIGDALSYGVAKVLPYSRRAPRKPGVSHKKYNPSKLAMSYAAAGNRPGMNQAGGQNG
jgi:hypothetical protein